MARNISIFRSLDWLTIGIYFLLVVLGVMNIYAANYNFDNTEFFNFSSNQGKQIIWIGLSVFIAGIILLVDTKTYDILAYIFYGFWLILLFITPFVTPRDIKGSLSWLIIGSFQFQPAEFAKCFTALAIAKYMSRYEYKVRDLRDFIVPFLLIALPMFIIMVLQKEAGSALVFAAFFFMFYREGMTGYILLFGAAAVFFFIIVIKLSVISLPLGTGAVGMTVAMLIILLIELIFLLSLKLKKEAIILFCSVCVCYAISLGLLFFIEVDFNIVSCAIVALSVLYLALLALRYRYAKLLYLLLFALFSLVYCNSCEIVFSKFLKKHQRDRIEVLLGLKTDPTGVEYNVNQAKIAIGSGGFWGKGFVEGTQTNLNFIPEQDTDFIFTTVGEEWGFMGTLFVLLLYSALVLRLIYIAERQKDRFSRIYAYSVAFIFFIHIAINIGMILGILPVIGIPLPFFSYGGSSMLGFTMLLFILLKLDASRVEKMR